MSICVCPNCNAYRGIKLEYRILRRKRYSLVCIKCGLSARGKNLEDAMSRWNEIAGVKQEEKE